MELAKSTETPEQPPHGGISSVAAREHPRAEGSNVDEDLARAWEVKSRLQWVRKDHGPVNRFRWLLWEKHRLGRPPSGVEYKPVVDQPGDLTTEKRATAQILRLVTFEGGSSRRVGSGGEPAPLDVIDHS